MALATRYRQPSYGPLTMIGVNGGVEPANYDQQLFTLGSFINDVLRCEVGNWSNNVTLPITDNNTPPADLYQSVMNAYGTALNACVTRRTIPGLTAWVNVTTLSAANWVTFYNQLAALACAVSNAITVQGI